MGSTYRVRVGGVEMWQAARSFTEIDPATGLKRRKRVTGTAHTRSAAVARLEEKLQGRGSAAPARAETVKPATAGEALTYREWFGVWVSELPTWRVSETVKAKYRRMGELHLLPRLGDTPVAELDSEDIERLIWRELMSDPTLSEATVRNIYRVCQMSLQAAVETRRVPLSANPARSIRAPRRSVPVANIEEEIRLARGLVKWLRETKEPSEARYLFQFLGLRRSERLGLAWSEIHNLEDDEKATLRVARQLSRRTDGVYVLTPPKTEAGVREIPLVEPFLTVLREWKATQTANRSRVEAAGGVWGGEDGRFADLVFLDENGRLITQNRDNLGWHALLNRYTGGSAYYRGHLNRHVTASLLAEAGVSVAVARTILGHASDAMTYYYTHVSNRAKRPAMKEYARELVEAGAAGAPVAAISTAEEEREREALRWL